jgi:hypothetical protein
MEVDNRLPAIGSDILTQKHRDAIVGSHSPEHSSIGSVVGKILDAVVGELVNHSTATIPSIGVNVDTIIEQIQRLDIHSRATKIPLEQTLLGRKGGEVEICAIGPGLVAITVGTQCEQLATRCP